MEESSIPSLRGTNVDRWRDDGAERIPLGDILLRPDQVTAYRAAGLDVGGFAHPAHQLTWRAIESLDAEGVQPDALAVRGRLKDWGTLEQVGEAYLLKLSDGVPRQAPANIGALVTRLDVLAHCRRVFYTTQVVLTRLAEDPTTIRNGQISTLITELVGANEGRRDARIPFVDDVTLLARPTAEYLVEGRIVARTLIGLYGDIGVGKTYVAADLAMCVCAGIDWLGARVRTSGTTVYVVAEGADQFSGRVRTWKLAHGFPLDQTVGFFTVPTAVQLLDADQVGALIATIRPLAPVLVAIDTLARSAVGMEENSAKEMGQLIAACDRIRTDVGTAVCVIHHSNQSGARERGSTALRGAVDTMMALMAADDLLTLSCEKQKDAPPFEPIRLRLVPSDGGGCVVRLADSGDDAAPLTKAQLQALGALRDHFQLTEGATAGEWQRAAVGLTERTFFRAKKQLVAKGHVRARGSRFIVVEASAPIG